MTFNLASFLNMTLKAWEMKEKIEKLDFKTKNFHNIGQYHKNIIIVKRKPRERKKIFINYLSDKSLICRLHKELNKKTTQFKRRQSTWIDISTKTDINSP